MQDKNEKTDVFEHFVTPVFTIDTAELYKSSFNRSHHSLLTTLSILSSIKATSKYLFQASSIAIQNHSQ